MGMLEGAVLMVIGVLLGRFLPGRRKGAAPAAEPPKPVCGCKHHHSFHDPGSGKCHGLADKPTHFTTTGKPIAWAKVPCTCRQYSGPVPLPEYMAQEIAGG